MVRWIENYFVFPRNGRSRTAGWVEKPIPQPTGFDGVIRPLLVSPCTSDVHNVEIDCLKPGRILGHEGLGE